MSLMNVRVAPCRRLYVCVCVFSRLLYAVVWHSPWQLWTFHSARTVRERRGEREGGGARWGEKGEGKTTSEGWVVLGARSLGRGSICLSVSGDSVHACMFWRSKVSARSPIITWWCVMKVRPVCVAKPYQRFRAGHEADTVPQWYADWSITQTFARVPVPRVPSQLRCVLQWYDNHPHFHLLPLPHEISICFLCGEFHVIQELWLQLRKPPTFKGKSTLDHVGQKLLLLRCSL